LQRQLIEGIDEATALDAALFLNNLVDSRNSDLEQLKT